MEENKILEAVTSLCNEMKAALAACDTNINRSADLKDLFAALAKAQGEMGAAGMNAENPFFKSRYADLAEVVKVSRPHLTKNGLCVMQQILPNDDGQNILLTILGHVSGQYIESRMRILPQKADVQSLGAYITYIRRFAYAALIGVVVSDEDDDGETEVADQRKTMAKGPASIKTIDVKTKGYETVTREQLDELELALEKIPDFVEDVLNGLKIQNLADMPKNKYPAAINRIRDVARDREGVK
jgi:hypothetical protein